MTVYVNVKNGVRYGSFDIHGIKGKFPTQAITSTNLNHTQYFPNPDFDFKTKIAEIVEFRPKKLVNDSEYRERRIKTVTKMINEYDDYLFLFTVKGARATARKTETGVSIKPFRFNKADNESLIEFQKECGFPLIKVFFKRAKSIQDSNYYRSLIPKNSFVASVDENMNHNAFRTMYLDCLRKKDQIISFFGRNPSKSKNTPHNPLNFAYISSRPYDQILRLTSFTSKAIDSAVTSLKFNWYRLDAYSFMTRRGPQDVDEYEMKVLDGFFYKPLLKTTNLICPITGKNLFQSSKEFENKYDKSSIPVTTHDIVRLNEELERLHVKYTHDEIKEILGDRI